MMPSSSEQMRSSNSSHESTTCAFDLFFDIPHPAASPASCERAKVIEPPGRIHPDVSELYHPNNISKIPRFAFPDFDEQKDYGKLVLNNSRRGGMLPSSPIVRLPIFFFEVLGFLKEVKTT